jgi:mRNA interferase MazF
MWEAAPCRLTVDKITTVSKVKLGVKVGRLDDEDMVRLNQAMTVFLGMAVTPRAGREKRP